VRDLAKLGSDGKDDIPGAFSQQSNWTNGDSERPPVRMLTENW